MNAARAFSTVELIGAILLFSAATGGVLVMGRSVRDHRLAAAAANQRNAYATFQSQVALQGINPSLVANPLSEAINQGAAISGTATAGRNLNATFEAGAVSQPGGAQRSLAGSVRVDAVNYAVAAAGNQTARGTGIGFAIETSGPAAPAAANAIPLAPPVFNVTGDLTSWFDANPTLNQIATLPSSNPAGTVYRYTTDGSAPTGASPAWNNDPGWTPATFPAQVNLQAFHPDPQYSPSPVASATYTMRLGVTYARADHRADLYDFTIADLAAPDAGGVVLTASIDGFPIFYTFDGSDPATSPTALAYSGAFAPPAGLFNPTLTLKIVALSSDPRIASSAAVTDTLNSVQMALAAPSFITPNDQPLAPGGTVQLSVGSDASPRTEVNNGAPAPSSSQATSFPLN